MHFTTILTIVVATLASTATAAPKTETFATASVYAFNRDTRAVSIIDTPEWIPQSVMVLGLAVLLLQLVAWIVGRVRDIP